MPKDKITDYDATAANNTDVGGVSIAEGCNFGNMNNMGREIMSHLAELSNGTYPIKDTFSIADPADLTKIARFDCGSITTSTTRVITIPDKSFTLITADSPTFTDTADATKTITFDLTGITTSTDRSIAWPDAAGTVMLGSTPGTVSGTMTFSSATLAMADNKITRPQIEDYSETVNAIGSIGGGTQDIDLESGNVVTATVDTATTTFTFSNPPATGKAGSFTLILTNGGSQTVNWPASVDWASGTAPSLTASGVDVLTFVTVDGGTIWYGFTGGLDFS